MYSFGTSMPKLTGKLLGLLVLFECRGFLIHFRMFLRMMQWSNHCVPWQIFFGGCFCLGSGPFRFVWFVVSLDETQVWLGDLRVVWLGCVLLCLL